MRIMLTASIPVEAGNAAIKNKTIPEVIKKFSADHKPEAAYFFADDHGNRSCLFVVDMKDTSDIPVMAEPFFSQLNAQIHMRPVMNQQDLAAAMNKIGR